MYGPGVQARQLLIARRLIERGVRFVQLFHGDVQPWDSHDNIAGAHRDLGQQCDQAHRRPLDRPQTARAVRGDAGPLRRRVRPHARRSSWSAASRAWAATTTTGASPSGSPAAASKAATSTAPPTSSATRPSKTPVHVHDLHATILHLLGFDHTKLTYRYAGRDFRLTDVHGNVVKEILA